MSTDDEEVETTSADLFVFAYDYGTVGTIELAFEDILGTAEGEDALSFENAGLTEV